MTNEITELQLMQFMSYLAPRARDSHKGNFGHVLVIGGDYGYSGAVRLAAEAALRVGAGLVSVATRPEHAWTLNVCRPEIMCHGINNAQALIPLLEKATVIVIGPGLGKTNWADELFQATIKYPKPIVIDADALSLIGSFRSDSIVLTPHPGEAARLLEISTAEVQQNRLAAVQQLQQKWGGVAVLKGAGTLIATKESVAVCSAGNPGMATAGMGDVLSGVIAGLIGQQIPLAIAVKLAVCLHAEAGDLVAAAGQRGMLAMDLFSYLRTLVNP